MTDMTDIMKVQTYDQTEEWQDVVRAINRFTKRWSAWEVQCILRDVKGGLMFISDKVERENGIK